MSPRPKKQKLGPSAVALSARLGRPGGAHGRRKKPRAVARRQAIKEQEG